MSKVETPVSGDGDKGRPDGVSASPDDRSGADVHGRTAGGESGGGGYDNPHTGKEPEAGGFMGHGGQAEIGYFGGGQAGEGGDAPNAATGSRSADGDETGTKPPAAPVYAPHPVGGDAPGVMVVETNGVAQAEATGKIATDAAYEREQESPGSG